MKLKGISGYIHRAAAKRAKKKAAAAMSKSKRKG